MDLRDTYLLKGEFEYTGDNILHTPVNSKLVFRNKLRLKNNLILINHNFTIENN